MGNNLNGYKASGVVQVIHRYMESTHLFFSLQPTSQSCFKEYTHFSRDHYITDQDY